IISNIVPPIIIPEGDEDVNYLYNENITLWCNASGLPKPIVNWFFKGDGMSHWERLGKEFYDKEMISITGGELTISNADHSHQGLYSCTAENEAGFAEKIYYLNMKAPPVLLDNDGPVDISLVEAESYSFHCQATGSPEPTIRWVKDGIELPLKSFDGSYFITDGGFKLDILAERGNTDGFYTCIAENEAGKVEKSFKVKVFVPPAHANFHVQKKPASLNVKAGDSIKITCPIATGLAIPAPVYVPPIVEGLNNHNVEVIKGESTSLNCSIIGNPKPTITWHKLENGVQGKIRKIHTTSLSTLELQNIHHDESGIYKCKGSSHIGSTEKTFNDGEMLHTEQIITSENGRSTGHLRIDDNGRSLYVEAVTLKDAGNYSCFGFNRAGRVTAHAADVELEDDSPILDPVKIGQNVTLECNPDGNPKPSIVWFKNGYLLGNSFDEKQKSQIGKVGLISEDGRKLYLHDVDKDSDGIYSCTAFNKVGSTERTFTIETVAPPVFYNWDIPDMVKVLNGSSVKFDCSATGKPKPKIQWSRLPPKDELKTVQLAENNPPLDPKKGISTTSQLLFDSINVQNSAV
ncbi:hypothetical protein J437_LFUL006386, partial [Ladona fulva]